MRFPTVNQLSIVLGPVIGPCTIATYGLKSLVDIPRLAFSALNSPSSQDLKEAKRVRDEILTFPDKKLEEMWPKVQKILRAEERYQLNKSKLAEDFCAILIGIIRSIPFFGGIVLTAYDLENQQVESLYNERGMDKEELEKRLAPLRELAPPKLTNEEYIEIMAAQRRRKPDAEKKGTPEPWKFDEQKALESANKLLRKTKAKRWKALASGDESAAPIVGFPSPKNGEKE